MTDRKNIFAIIGSASQNSSNLKLVQHIAEQTKDRLQLTIFDQLAQLPHFDPERSASGTPAEIVAFRQAIEQADGLLICTPEYIFSIPSGLKNAIEWCVSTTVFANKPIGIITASANGQMAHDELKLIMRTVETVFTADTTLLIQGVKGKIDVAGTITHVHTKNELNRFIQAYTDLVLTTQPAT